MSCQRICQQVDGGGLARPDAFDLVEESKRAKQHSSLDWVCVEIRDTAMTSGPSFRRVEF